MRRSGRQIARLYTTVDLTSVMSIYAELPTGEADGFAQWDDEDAASQAYWSRFAVTRALPSSLERQVGREERR
jgi:hypothetical protein